MQCTEEDVLGDLQYQAETLLIGRSSHVKIQGEPSRQEMQVPHPVCKTEPAMFEGEKKGSSGSRRGCQVPPGQLTLGLSDSLW